MIENFTGGMPHPFNIFTSGQGQDGSNGLGGNWLVILFLIIMMGGGNGLFGGKGMPGMGMGGGAASAVDEGILLNAIQGNREAVNELSQSTGIGIAGLEKGLAQISVGLANTTGDIKALIAEVNAAVASGNQTVISNISNALHGLQTQMMTGDANISKAISDCCCSTKAAIAEINSTICNQTNVLQNQATNNTQQILNALTQNQFAIQQQFCAQNRLISDENERTRKELVAFRMQDLQAENTRLQSQLTQERASAELLSSQRTIIAAINNN